MNPGSFIAALSLAVTAVPLAAQGASVRTMQFGLMGGITSPAGDVSSLTRHDGNVGALVSLGAPTSHVSFRIDGQWQQLAGIPPHAPAYTPCARCTPVPLPNTQDYRVLDMTANVLYNFEPTSTASLYLIGGIGAYNERQTDRTTGARESLASVGVNGGVGVKFNFRRIQPFVEARYHNIIGGHSFAYGLSYPPSSSFQFVPINVGIIF